MPCVLGATDPSSWFQGVYRLADALARPYTLLFLLTWLAFAHLWRRRRESRARLLWLALPFGALTVLSLPPVGYLALGSLEWGYPPCESRPAGAEAIVVLSGSAYARDAVRPRASLGDSSLFRCLEAGRVYRLGAPIPVLATGGSINADGSGPSCAELMADFLRTQGVRDADLVVEGRALSTYENAVETRKELGRRGVRKIILVTEATHMRRSAWCFRKQGFEVTPWPCHHLATEFRPSVFLAFPNPDSARACLTAAHEWMGIAWYRLTGKV